MDRAPRTVTPPATDIQVPEVLRLPAGAKPPGARLPDDRWTIGEVFPLDRWIFGQYNKLLPAKVSCRGLANLLLNEPKGVPVERAAMDIALSARALGSILREYDSQFTSDRDNALGTAFPNEDEDGKSVTRYATQFVAGINKAGQVSGLLIDLKLINYTNTKDVRLQLTDPECWSRWRGHRQSGQAAKRDSLWVLDIWSSNHRGQLHSGFAVVTPPCAHTWRTLLPSRDFSRRD